MKDIREDGVGSDNELGRAAIPAAAAEVDQDGSDTEADPELLPDPELDPELELVHVPAPKLLPQDDGTEVGGRGLGSKAAAMPTMRPTAAAAAAAERSETLVLLLLLLPPESMSIPMGWQCGAAPVDRVLQRWYCQYLKLQ